jgi:hypothetical protein
MKIAYCILHQGKPYLKTAVEAIFPQVDLIYIFYSDKPSQGFSSNIPCPDTKEELLAEIKPFMSKIKWVDGDWAMEGDHNDAIWQHVTDKDWIIRFDADEIYPEGSVDWFISEAEKKDFKEYRIHFMHFWRSFKYVCYDSQCPMRIMRMTGTGCGYLDDTYKVFHMGYAQPTKYIEYKMQVSGHRPEWRPNWFSEKWLTNAKDDIHPVSYLPVPLWNAVEYNGVFPKSLQNHQYSNLEVIE